ncbi:MAG: hypothetical protein AB7U51_09750 [Arcobacter sp.]|uniref:hypothetical protein n=1 Tax=Arcobacter sp. TaxID=1872629 RepID=UPI003D04A989
MPYLVSSIIAVVSAMIILFTRYEADDSTITGELDRLKSMFVTVDGFVNTYIQSGGSLSNINFEELDKAGILLSNMEITPVADTISSTGENKTTTTFPSSEVVWQIIPNIDDSSSYKLLVDMSQDRGLMSKAIFSESFSGREFCEKMLFGTFDPKGSEYIPNDKDFGSVGNERDGIFVCIVFK